MRAALGFALIVCSCEGYEPPSDGCAPNDCRGEFLLSYGAVTGGCDAFSGQLLPPATEPAAVREQCPELEPLTASADRCETQMVTACNNAASSLFIVGTITQDDPACLSASGFVTFTLLAPNGAMLCKDSYRLWWERSYW